jgi:hypothetical protein
MLNMLLLNAESLRNRFEFLLTAAVADAVFLMSAAEAIS